MALKQTVCRGLAFPLISSNTRCHAQLLSTAIRKTEDPFYREGISEVIDVRSPEEYKSDHIPGAVNLPILTIEQFQTVGKLHSLESEKTGVLLTARLVGAKFSLQNIIKIIDTHLMDKPHSYSPLIYCKRGGLRSRSLATVMSEIGFPVVVLEGGYRTYRRRVLNDLDQMGPQFQYKVITGSNKSGKALVMKMLRDRGHQVLNFDKMLNYEDLFLTSDLWKMKSRGCYMETKVREKLASFDPSKPVWVKHQVWQNNLMKRTLSAHVLMAPNSVYRQMMKGKIYEMKVPNEAKVDRLVNEGYLDWIKENQEKLHEFLEGNARKMYDSKSISFMVSYLRKNDFSKFLSLALEEEHKNYKLLRRRYSRKFMGEKSSERVKQELLFVENLSQESILALVKKLENDL